MPSGEYWPSDNVQPGVGSVVDVLYYVHGKKAYFRGTVRGVRDVEQGLALRIAFKRQTHYKLAFPAEVVTIAWKAGVVWVVLNLCGVVSAVE